MRAMPSFVLAKTVVSVADRLGRQHTDVAAVIGESEGAIACMRRGGQLNPEREQGELGLILIRLFRSLHTTMGKDDSKSRLWFHAHNVRLGGVSAERVCTVEGLVEVVWYLEVLAKL